MNTVMWESIRNINAYGSLGTSPKPNTLNPKPFGYFSRRTDLEESYFELYEGPTMWASRASRKGILGIGGCG